MKKKLMKLLRGSYALSCLFKHGVATTAIPCSDGTGALCVDHANISRGFDHNGGGTDIYVYDEYFEDSGYRISYIQSWGKDKIKHAKFVFVRDSSINIELEYGKLEESKEETQVSFSDYIDRVGSCYDGDKLVLLYFCEYGDTNA